MRKYLYALLLGSLSLVSCDKEEEEIGGTAIQNASGEWFVQARYDDGSLIPGVGTAYFHFGTYNTAGNSASEIILDDFASFWGNSTDGRVAGKLKLDLAKLTFSGANVPNVNPDYPVDMTVTEGKILKGAAKASGSKVATDSIRFVIEYSDDAGTKYVLAGYKKTGFREDNH